MGHVEVHLDLMKFFKLASFGFPIVWLFNLEY